MIAYYVHDSKKENDTIVLPEIGCSVVVDTEKMLEFISVHPEFAQWSGDRCAHLSPEDFGTVIAARNDRGDVRIIDQDLWRERMQHYLVNPAPGAAP
jgi:hypothetical protein